MHAILTPWKNWNQQTDAGDGGEISLNRYNDCGQESVAEVIWYLTGVELEADYIKDEMYGENYVGYSDSIHLSDYLINKTASMTVTYAGNAALLEQNIKEALLAGHPVIQLFYFDLENLTGGHWCPIIEVGDVHFVRSNPWIGLAETYTWQEFATYQKGVLLVCKRKRCFDA